ncbi:MAG: hypothetical protein JST20_09970, partial [Bacteroidetes bacterium]|nr:hypothetical protein [Bacteroidota bacterium]
MKINLTTLFILFIYSTVCVRAQFNETIRSDRPGQAIVPFTVGKYIFQTQTGIDIGGSNSSESTIISRFYAPNISLRFGLTKNVELVSNWEYRYDRNNTNNTINSAYGLSLSSIGSRINFYEGESYEPSIGLQLTFKLPILAEAYNPNYIAPKIT